MVVHEILPSVDMCEKSDIPLSPLRVWNMQIICGYEIEGFCVPGCLFVEVLDHETEVTKLASVRNNILRNNEAIY